MRAARIAVLGFCAGFLAVLIFHQGVILLMYGGGLVPNPPFPMRPVPPFGVPQVISLAFWGGVWGILIGAIASARRFPTARDIDSSGSRPRPTPSQIRPPKTGSSARNGTSVRNAACVAIASRSFSACATCNACVPCTSV